MKDVWQVRRGISPAEASYVEWVDSGSFIVLRFRPGVIGEHGEPTAEALLHFQLQRFIARVEIRWIQTDTREIRIQTPSLRVGLRRLSRDVGGGVKLPPANGVARQVPSAVPNVTGADQPVRAELPLQLQIPRSHRGKKVPRWKC